MTYFGFLALFLLIPIALFAFIAWRDHKRDKPLPQNFRTWSPGWVLFIHLIIAVVYTTPWDNYLVATRVWWYDPALVTGLTIGWVPIEEYTFFVLQPILTGLWLIFLMRRWPMPKLKVSLRRNIRWGTVIVGLIIWLGAGFVLWQSWQPGNYLALELAWAFIPIIIQLAFGADILWRYKGLVFTAIALPTFYLSAADWLAIGSGTWTINPQKSLNIFLAGHLPIEEFIFFLLTNVLLVFGMTLALAQESQGRLKGFLAVIKRNDKREMLRET